MRRGVTTCGGLLGFGERHLQTLKNKDIADFEAWRNHRMGITPKNATLMTFASAFNRVHQKAIDRGWIKLLTCLNRQQKFWDAQYLME